MAEAGKIPITCPDCGQTLDAPVTVNSEGYIVRLTDDFTDQFAGHVLAAPENHPTFATPNPEPAPDPDPIAEPGS